MSFIKSELVKNTIKWSKYTGINPTTGRKIKSTGKMYQYWKKMFIRFFPLSKPKKKKVSMIVKSLSQHTTDYKHAISYTKSPYDYKKELLVAKPFDINRYNPKSKTRLGQGSYGTAYLITTHLNKQLVLKKIKKTKSDFEDVVKEALILQHLKNYCGKYIICFDGFYQDTDHFYITTDYVKGGVEPLEFEHEYTTESLKTIITHLINGLQLLHAASIVHRDIKLDNVLRVQSDDSIRYIDFGLSCWGNQCHTDGRYGTSGYMAPELINSKLRKVWTKYTLEDSKKFDIFSLGIVIWELLMQLDFWDEMGQQEYAGPIDEKLQSPIVGIKFHSLINNHNVQPQLDDMGFTFKLVDMVHIDPQKRTLHL